MMDKKLMILFVVKPFAEIKYIKKVKEKYNTKVLHTIKQMEEYLDKERFPELIILDDDLIMNQSDINVIRIKCKNKSIPVMLMVDFQKEIIDALNNFGILDYIYKPVIPRILLHRIDIHMQSIKDINFTTKMSANVHNKLKTTIEDFARIQSITLEVLAEVIEFRGYDTNYHNLRIEKYLNIILKKMIEVPNKYSREIALWNIETYVKSSQLHDIGKVCIPSYIVTKQESLTDEEFNIVKQHIQSGIDIIDRILERIGTNEYLEISKSYIKSHHENWDGSGYPEGLSGTDIPLEGRILSILDTYDALTSNRPYHNKESQTEAIKEINKLSGIRFDPELVNILNLCTDEFLKIQI